MSDNSLKEHPVLLLTESLVAAVSAGDWEKAAELEKERFSALEGVLSAFRNAGEDQEEIIQLMIQVKSMDAALVPLIAEARTHVARELAQFNATSHAERAYRSCYED